MGNLVITVGREFGSGGRTVAKLVAEHFGIKCYDKNILALAAEKSGLNEKFIESYDEKAVSGLGFLTGQGFYFSPRGANNDIHVEAYFSQFNVIRELAKKESCVIVGRAGNYILRDEPGMISVFISADRADRVDRIMKYEKISDRQAEKAVDKYDKNRAKYYNFFSNMKWGEAKTYDLCINSSKLGIEGAAKIVIDYVEARLKAEADKNSGKPV